MQQGRAFPICELKTKERGDEFDNGDGVFEIVGWAPRSSFDAILGPADEVEKPAIAAPKRNFSNLPGYGDPEVSIKSYGVEQNPARRSAAEIIDDDLPF